MTAVRTYAAHSAWSEDRQDIVRALPPFFAAVRRRRLTNWQRADGSAVAPSSADPCVRTAERHPPDVARTGGEARAGRRRPCPSGSGAVGWRTCSSPAFSSCPGSAWWRPERYHPDTVHLLFASCLPGNYQGCYGGK